MTLVDLQQHLEYFGPAMLSGTRCRNYIGATVTPEGLTSQVILRATNANILFNTTIDDVGGWFSGAAPTRLTVPQGVARVRVHVALRFVPGGTPVVSDQVFMSLFMNGAIVPDFGRQNVALTVDNLWCFTTLPIPTVPTDYFEVNVSYFASVSSPSLTVQNIAESVFAIEAVTC